MRWWAVADTHGYRVREIGVTEIGVRPRGGDRGLTPMLDGGKLSALAWKQAIGLEDGIRRAYADNLKLIAQ